MYRLIQNAYNYKAKYINITQQRQCSKLENHGVSTCEIILCINKCHQFTNIRSPTTNKDTNAGISTSINFDKRRKWFRKSFQKLCIKFALLKKKLVCQVCRRYIFGNILQQENV